ncbi:MAG: hypothetical protein JWN09_934, partial [Microbacteriaceae bacterium]|nr:hypothetical protein [Microbacteriaceae bacterium]
MPSKDHEELDPRVHITDEKTGEVRGVPKSAVTGLDEFAESWKNAVDLPDELTFSGWQMVDDDHPPGKGYPAYRIVYKTIR